jgi:hypothetical protein
MASKKRSAKVRRPREPKVVDCYFPFEFREGDHKDWLVEFHDLWEKAQQWRNKMEEADLAVRSRSLAERLKQDRALVKEEQRQEEEFKKLEHAMAAEKWKPIHKLLDAFARQDVVRTMTKDLPPEAAQMVRNYIDHPDRDPTKPTPEVPDPPPSDPTESD